MAKKVNIFIKSTITLSSCGFDVIVDCLCRHQHWQKYNTARKQILNYFDINEKDTY
jgi:glutaredoxin-related protein